MRRLIKIIRNSLLLAIAAIIILAAVLAFNVVSHSSRQMQVAAVPRAAVDAQAAATRLAEAIRFKTISSYEKPDQHAEALRGMQAHIEKSFPAFHAAAKREIVADYSLLYSWEGSDPNTSNPKAQPIALLAHQDVVPVAPAGDKDNVLPGNAAASVNFRLIPGDTQAGVIDHVRDTIDNDRISIAPFAGNTDPPPVTATANASYQMLAKTIREIYPDVIVAPGLMIAATDSRHYAGITNRIFRFSPVRANGEDLKRFHGTNERLSIEGYADMIRFYRRLIENSAG
jgi:acetylornithine deacetylase/succinyl-diaminopimelate desuccinylase-like protein